MTRSCLGFSASLALALAIANAGCTSLQRDYGVSLATTPVAGSSATPSPGATGTAAPSACATQNPTATQIAMVSFITATPDPTYGVISGYAIVTNGSAPVVAQPVGVRASTVVQFVNGEQPGTPSIYHSAVGFPGVGAFPAEPFAFAAADARPLGSQIGSAAWSTGRLAPGCYSQSFDVPAAGTYYYGDYDYYNLSNVRDVIVASP